MGEANMQINTTINIKSSLLFMLSEVSGDHGLSINKIIMILIYKLLKNCSIKATLFNTVKYQRTVDDIAWHTLHVSFSGDIYEKALDLRKVMKMSVSYLIARAIELYLNEVINEISQKKHADNYLQEYAFISGKNKKSLNFTIFWHAPSKGTIKKYTNKYSEDYYIRQYIS